VKSFAVISVILMTMLSFSFSAQAHVPLVASGNDNISSAIYVSDPGKSWAIYGSLDAQKSQYYSFDLVEGERIYLSLLKSADPKELNFQPGLALLGPGVKMSGQMPQNVVLPRNPEDYGTLAVKGISAINATYEPFGPSSYVEMATINISSPKSARYYAIVYSNDTPGHYSLAIGTREEFSFSERIITPVRLISVYIWEGQRLGVILIPFLAAEIIGILIFWRGTRRTAFRLAGTLAGFLFIATSATVFTQGAFSLTRATFGDEVYITLAIAVFHAVLGVASIRLANGEAGILQRTLMAITGTLALLAGSGLILGPILAMVASFLPSKRGPIPRDSIEKL
jgi:hypothetical protein